MKNRLILTISIFIIFLSGCSRQPIDEQWVNLVSNNGLAVTFAMFVIFIVLPSLGLATWRIISWIGKRIDRIIDRHELFLDEISEINHKIVNSLHPIEANLEKLNEIEPLWHQKKLLKLESIHDEVKCTHRKVDEINIKLDERRHG